MENLLKKFYGVLNHTLKIKIKNDTDLSNFLI